MRNKMALISMFFVVVSFAAQLLVGKDISQKDSQSPPPPDQPGVFASGVSSSAVVEATTTRPTADCLTLDDGYFPRAAAVDQMLPLIQPSTHETHLESRSTERLATIKEMSLSVLDLDDGDSASISKRLIDGGYTTALPQIEKLIEKQKKGGPGFLATDGNANFFFVIGRDGKTVSILSAHYQDQHQWRIHVRDLNNDTAWNTTTKVIYAVNS